MAAAAAGGKKPQGGGRFEVWPPPKARRGGWDGSRRPLHRQRPPHTTVNATDSVMLLLASTHSLTSTDARCSLLTARQRHHPSAPAPPTNRPLQVPRGGRCRSTPRWRQRSAECQHCQEARNENLYFGLRSLSRRPKCLRSSGKVKPAQLGLSTQAVRDRRAAPRSRFSGYDTRGSWAGLSYCFGRVRHRLRGGATLSFSRSRPHMC